jgi:hypothetical protein
LKLIVLNAPDFKGPNWGIDLNGSIEKMGTDHELCSNRNVDFPLSDRYGEGEREI